MSYFTWFWDVMLRFLGLISSRRAGADGQLGPPRLAISVRTNRGRHVPLELEPAWTIGRVKRELSTLLLLPAHRLRIVLAGKQLGDDVTVSQCDLGQGSVLHAITVEADPAEAKSESEPAEAVASSSSMPGSSSQPPLNESLLDLQLSPEEKSTASSSSSSTRPARAHFFVYCSRPCGDMTPGKLRVRCATCKQGSVEVQRDPQDWDDVLLPERVRGHCHNDRCQADADSTFVQFYFKCAAQTGGHGGEDESQPPLHLVKSNLHSVPCLTCGDVCDPVLVFDCPDRHVICLDCFRTYCLTRLNERRFVLHDDFGYTLPCPAGCTGDAALVSETRHFKLIGDEAQYERYQRFGAEECVLRHGGVLCPQPDCGQGILLPDEALQGELCRRVTCENGCGYVFCRDCLQGFHVGDCDVLQPDAASSSASSADASASPSSATVSQARWLNADPTSMMIRMTTKPCPQCRTPTERSGGCMHMVCTKAACGFHWCWICQTEWTRDCMASHWFG